MKYSLFHSQRLWLRYAYDQVQWRLFLKHRELIGSTFSLEGADYDYYVHPYNHTWDNERAVELPVALQHLESQKAGRILELGNVLSHYIRPQHDIIDKYETDTLSHIMNIDILDYNPGHTYDLILSISTLEHVGWDEVPKDPGKAIKALDKLKSLLSDAGLAVLSVPVGYNQFLDDFIYNNRHYFDTIAALRRVSLDNRWEETGLDVAKTAKYNCPFNAANAVWFVTLRHHNR